MQNNQPHFVVWSHFVAWKWLYMFAFLSVCLTIRKIFWVGSAGLSTMTTMSSAALMKNTVAMCLLECGWLLFLFSILYYIFSNSSSTLRMQRGVFWFYIVQTLDTSWVVTRLHLRWEKPTNCYTVDTLRVNPPHMLGVLWPLLYCSSALFSGAS